MVVLKYYEGKYQAIFVGLHGTIVSKQNTIYAKAKEAITKAIAHKYKVIIITNQQGLKDEYSFIQKMNQLKKELGFTAFYYCTHPLEKKCSCRKPKSGMILKAKDKHNIIVKKSWVIGDKFRDVIAGNHLDCKTILLNCGANEKEKQEEGYQIVFPTYIANDILEAINYVINRDSKSKKRTNKNKA